MKVRYLLALLVIAMISACAPAEVETPEVTPPVDTPPAAPEPTEVVEPQPPEPETVEVEVMYAGYDPSELTVLVGSTIVFKSIQGKHKLTVDGKGQPTLEEDTSQEVVADEVGSLRIFDIFTKKTMNIEVVEEMPEAMTEPTE
ncbi:MAG: hypothetical protein QF824_04205 [Candidatus Woesearchaeota archaeon]|jgi:plastocyanin|nr:hypothetical protein [Candidatus Woesearchaeota archaeon]